MHKINSFYPTLGQSWAVVAIFLIASLALSFLVAINQAFSGTSPGSWIMLIGYIIPFFFVNWYIHRQQRKLRQPVSPDEYTVMDVSHITGTRRKLSPMLYLWLLLFTPLLAIVVEPLTAWLPMPEYIQGLFENISQRNVPTLLMIAIAAPLCEEWMCRGVIAKGLLWHMTPAKAIVWSAFIFALIHLNPWQAVPAFVFGLFLGYVYWKTQSLWPCIFIHFVNNGFSYLLLYLFPDMNASATMHDVAGDDYWKLYLIAALAAVYVGYLVKKQLTVEY
ncbi:MAG: CPBP family intramembrane metalloprotease [Prevotellaceae bacterium]|jgi:membrane protease YdiL (CAAX protease family)|nr:CPBP family intramembrane metalloprotease [Prevotellaceae bacterium]